tara:strand:- start:471 stop:1058 length:588 start_codon:yes stop_codon:yes gene_type:complete
VSRGDNSDISSEIGEGYLPHRIKAKVFFQNQVDPESVIPVFNRWISDRTLEDHLMIDIADYRHVPNGPSVILVGHEADIVIDHGDGWPGLAYIRKGNWQEASNDHGDALSLRIHIVLNWLVKIAKELNLTTRSNEFGLWFQDRLFVRQTNLQPVLNEAIKREAHLVLGEGHIEVAPIQTDSRRALGFNARLMETN